MSSDPEDPSTRRARFEATAVPLLAAVYAAARRLARGRAEEAADLTQETYLRAYRTFEGFTPGTNCKAWLLTILYSVFVNRYHRAQREPEALEPEAIERRFEQLARSGGHEQDVETDLIRYLDGAGPEVRSALDRLPEAFRAALWLVDVEELTYEEAAQALGCPVGTVRSRLFRGRKLLFLELADYARRSGYLKDPEGS